jgi:repressor LexA
VGFIAAGSPIQAIEQISYINIPEQIKTDQTCYILQVKGECLCKDPREFKPSALQTSSKVGG